MRLPKLEGLIRRRLLVNFRVPAEVMRDFLPAPLQPKLHRGYAIAGICLIRLEQIRPVGLPECAGLDSENAAHRIAVVWNDDAGRKCEGVYIPRRDTSSRMNAWAGGRLFPGETHLATFDVREVPPRLSMKIRSEDGVTSIDLEAVESSALPSSSCFQSLQESSDFFRGGSVGYSTTRDCCRLDGMELETDGWQVRPLTISHVESSFFSHARHFPSGAVEFDHALIMRDVTHRWKAVEQLALHGANRQAVQGGPPLHE